MRYVEACEAKDWHFHLASKGSKNLDSTVFFRCKSWRHHGSKCQLWKGAQDFSRVRETLKRFTDWYYLCLTYPQNEWPDKQALYRAGVTHWARLRKRIIRKFGKIKYVQTWEAHASGGPHVNVIVSSPGMAECWGEDWRGLRAVLNPHAVEVGFGKRFWIEPVRPDLDILTGYMVKCARELIGAGPKCQIPYNAPKHFRRLRASQKTLPPVYRSGVQAILRLVPKESCTLCKVLGACPAHEFVAPDGEILSWQEAAQRDRIVSVESAVDEGILVPT
jgi:hypothetical protein